MQLIAFENGKIISTIQADRKRDYTCPECKRILRFREGPYRHPHFYHLVHNPACSQSKKILAHIHIQIELLKMIPSNTAQIEKYFYKINRTTDIYWPEQNIVFEIQCSPISFHEAYNRIIDYRSQGLEPIWILHDYQFNKQKLSPAERFLRSSTTCYYTNMSINFPGKIYDQIELISYSRRTYKSRPYYIDIAQPKRRSVKAPPISVPYWILKKIKASKILFDGDVIDMIYRRMVLSNELFPKRKDNRSIWWKILDFILFFHFHMIKEIYSEDNKSHHDE